MATRDPARQDRGDGLDIPRSLVAASRRDATKNSRGPGGSLSCTRASALLVATVVRTPVPEVPSPHTRGHSLRVAQSSYQSSSKAFRPCGVKRTCAGDFALPLTLRYPRFPVEGHSLILVNVLFYMALSAMDST